MDNKKLLLILFVLLAIYGANKFFNKPATKSFKEELVRLDTAKIDKIILSNPQGSGAEITLERKENLWTATQGQLTVTATKAAVESTLTQAAYIKANRLVSRSKENWEQYEVDETNGAVVKLYGKGKELASFVAGRINFNQQSRSATSYIRLYDDEDTYATEGFLSMAFKQDFNSFRNRTVTSLNKEDITQLILSGDKNMTLSKSGTQWSDQDGALIDSTNMAAYLSGITNVNGTTFKDDFNSNSTNPNVTLQIVANNQLTPLILKSFPLSDSTWVINSNVNPEGNFESDANGIYSTLILEIDKIYKPTFK